ncbi:hypothetical protein [Haloarcula onubensis]|uniref:DUF4239 domain-containing protein n=1 Tax=Haloarcula onubensis TaxID=2950539 RepID=A0ABU2FJN0_9EURY|nr:hypothetical protein [Halomicroarcula sp. S3CR25-11]MDS0280541.1 hypothetical protein [Halomicroarcula sp. S3CR25-11]
MSTDTHSERRRPVTHRAVDWLLLGGNRLVVAGGIVVVTLALLLAVEPLGPLTDRNTTPLFYVFSAFIGGNLNLLTIVLSINQLVLTRELKSPGKFRGEIAGIRDFREDVEAVSDQESAPLTPAAFARELADAMGETVVSLRADGAPDDGAVAVFADDLAADVESVRAALDREMDATDDVVIALLRIDAAALHHRAEQLRSGASLSGADRELLDRLATQLELLVVTREHYKQLFTRESLSNMSRVLLYVGVPAEIAMTLVLVRFVGLGGPTPVALPPVLIYAAAAVGLAPLAVVFAYVLRAATIARRTATTTQFSTGAEEL